MLQECIWNIYSEGTRPFLGVGLYVTGVLSMILCSFLIWAIVNSRLYEERAHLMLLNLCAASLARTLLGGFLWAGSSVVAGRWLFGGQSCIFYGFLQQFFGVYQIEALTHLCIERYVVAKYFKHGWDMAASRYLLFFSLCCFFSVMYSIPPFLGVGQYTLDYTCCACTFDLKLSYDSWTTCTLIVILLLLSVKPAFLINSMLQWAEDIEKECYNKKDHAYELLLTKSAKFVSSVTLLSWTPGFVTSSWVILSQLWFGQILQPPMILALMSSILSEFTPALIVISILWSNVRLRNAVVVLFGDPHDKTI